MTLLNSIKNIFQPSSNVSIPSSGLYHYVHENEMERSRIHLRIDPDGTGTLIVNASSVMHLNPTATFMAWMILEGKTEEDRILALTSRYSVSKRKARNDLSDFLFQFEEMIRPDGACPVHELDLDTTMPFSARPTAPHRMDLAVTYRCNNDCAIQNHSPSRN